MNHYLAAAAMASALTVPAVSAQTYTIDPGYTVPSFEIQHMATTTLHGQFKKTEGKIVLDAAHRKGSVDATIYTDSLDMSSEAWTAHMKEEELFNVAKHPVATFHSDQLVFSGNTPVAAKGELTIVGMVVPITLKITGFRCDKQRCLANVTTQLKRSSFGMNKYTEEVSDDISVQIPVAAVRN